MFWKDSAWKERMGKTFCSSTSRSLARYLPADLRAHRPRNLHPQTLSGLYNVKDRLPSGTQRDVVYSVKCETCQDEYVGETLRALEVRSKEHRDAIRLNHPEKSAIAEHVLERNGSHDIDWTNVRVIDRAAGMKERKVREAFAIEERKPAMNRDKGVEKSRTWNGLFT